MKQIGSYVLVAAALFITYQSYENSREGPETEAFAKRVACDVASNCILQAERPGETRTDPFRRRYEFKTTLGPVLVTCKRDMVWLGDWKCESEMGGFLSF